MEKKKEKADPKLYELEAGTLIQCGIHILEFLGIDGMYARRRNTLCDDIVIMGHANQNVSEYGKILDFNE